MVDQPNNSFKIPKQFIMQVKDSNGKILVQLFSDGKIDYGEDYDPDITAKIFWEAISNHAPKPIPNN